MKETSRIREFFTRALKDGDCNFAWYNTGKRHKRLTEIGIKELTDYLFKKDEISALIVVKDICIARPQRTMGGIPEWFRPASEYKHFDSTPDSNDNDFVFMVFDKDYNKENLEKAFNSFPSNILKLKIEK